MKAWLRQHRHALRMAVRKLLDKRSAAVVCAVVSGIALAIPVGGYTLLDSLRSLAGRLNLEPQISLFLRAGVAPGDAQALQQRLRSDSRVADARFVPRDEALRTLAGDDSLQAIVAALGRNPLPDAIVVQGRETSPESVQALAGSLRAEPAVEHVLVESDWVRRLAALAAAGRVALFFLVALLSLGLLAVTFNTIRLQILTQHDEIEVAKLIGATDSFIQRPFLYLGFLQGVAGGIVAACLVELGVTVLNPEVRLIAQTYGSAFALGGLSFADAITIGVFSGILGWLGASLSVSRYLREIL